MAGALNSHLVALTPGIEAGRVVPLLGAGVNFLARPGQVEWEPNAGFVPGGWELFRYLAQKFEYPDEGDGSLMRLTQYVSVVAGRGTLYDELHRLFDADFPVTDVHRFVASLPDRMRQKGNASYRQLVVTTNYDDIMERAFREAGEPFDVVWYVADGTDRGKFMHRLYSGELRLIERIQEYRDLDLEKRSVVLKLHGSVDRFDAERDSYVITEDDYLEYLVGADVTTLLPPEIVTKLYRSHFLFMGYGLRDWNLQVILHRIWGEQKIATKSWAIQLDPHPVDTILWDRRNVDIVDAPLDLYIRELNGRVDAVIGRA